jgi:Rrf2 family protein
MARLLPLSKGCQYAIRTAASLTLEPLGTVFPRREVSRRTQIPYAFVSKILQSLTRGGLLRSHRGAKRGYSLARAPKGISLLDVVTVYDGPLGHEGCLLDDYKLCPGEHVCRIHHRRMAVQKKMTESLSSVSVSEVARTLFTRRGNGNYKLAEPV